MRPWRALLLFPARPGAAAAALPRPAALAAPAPPLLLLLYLSAGGCALADAALAAAGLLLLVLGLGAGGAVASALARRLLEHAPRRGPQVHLVFSAWAVTLFVLALLLTGSALGAALGVLVWGVVAGTAVIADDAEPGRSLVASCAGTAGAVLGLLALGLLVHERMVMVLPSKGGTLLVRRGEVPEPHALVLLRDPPSSRLFLARKGPDGFVPEGAPPPGAAAGWTVVGRVFFFLGTGTPPTIP
jgi:hypothetical protein